MYLRNHNGKYMKGIHLIFEIELPTVENIKVKILQHLCQTLKKFKMFKKKDSAQGSLHLNLFWNRVANYRKSETE